MPTRVCGRASGRRIEHLLDWQTSPSPPALDENDTTGEAEEYFRVLAEGTVQKVQPPSEQGPRYQFSLFH